MTDKLETIENLVAMLDTKSTMEEFLQAFELVLTYVQQMKTDNEAERGQIQKLAQDAIQSAVEKSAGAIEPRLIQFNKDQARVAWDEIMKRVALLKDGTDGVPGKDGASIVGPPGPPGESIKGDKGEPGQDGSNDSPDEVVEKVNKGKPLIKKERVEGLADIERIAKENAFNPTMGPSFSDLRDLQSQITANKKVTINYIIDGGGSALTTGVKGFVEIPYAMTITGWQIFADQSGSVVVDVWKDSYANFPPTVADTITGSEKPTLSSAQNNQDLSLSTWNTSLTAGDILAYNVDSISTITRVTVSIIGVKI